MPKRVISLTDKKKRDAHVEIESPKSKERFGSVNAEGDNVASERLIKSTEHHIYSALLEKHGCDDAELAQALVDGDPEIPFARAGRRVGPIDRVWIRPDNTILYCARPMLVKFDAKGEELDRGDFIDVEATVSDENPLPWTGRLFPISEVVRRFAIGRKLRVRHVNGLTFDFLYDIAKDLHDEKKMLLVGTGKKGVAPLIFQTNGTPYRGFLEGRIDGNGYMLLLHLSNLELKRIPE